jgi:long-chain acyl-CoA synthetase
MSDRYGYPASLEVGLDAQPGESRVRRLRFTADRLLTSPAEGISTTWDIINFAANKFGDKPSMGWRDVVDTVTEEKVVTKTIDGKQVQETKKWQFFQLSDFKYLSFKEVRTAVSEVGRGLLELGIEKDEIFNIYSRTR